MTQTQVKEETDKLDFFLVLRKGFEFSMLKGKNPVKDLYNFL